MSTQQKRHSLVAISYSNIPYRGCVINCFIDPGCRYYVWHYEASGPCLLRSILRGHALSAEAARVAACAAIDAELGDA